jgi:serine/threonine protein kinase
MPYKYPIKFGKYLLTKRIAVGGMAELFLAKMIGIKGFEKTLAVKKILPEFGEDEEFVELFVDEAKISVQLQHANIVQVFDFGEIDNSYYIAMEFVDGPNLKNLLKRCLKKKGNFPVEITIHIVLQVLKALDYAQRVTIGDKMLNLVHRDVSPQNVLISREGETKITDFGIAKATIKASKTQPGKIQGKFSYMSPEQSTGGEIDHRSDIFSLGIIFFEMLTGFKLYSGDDTTTKWARVREAKIPAPSQYNAGITRELETIVMKMLAKDPRQRYQNAAEIIKELTDYLYPSSTEAIAASLASLVKELFPVPLSQELDIPIGKILEVEKDRSTQTDFKLLKSEKDGGHDEGPVLLEKKKSVTRASINIGPARSRSRLFAILGFLIILFIAIYMLLIKPDEKIDGDNSFSISPTPAATQTTVAVISPEPTKTTEPVDLLKEYAERKKKEELANPKGRKISPLPPPKIEKPKATPPPQKCPDGMVYVPGGPFLFGSSQSDSDFNFGEIEQPQVVPTKAFCIDKFESPNSQGSMPITDLTFIEAKKSCLSMGKHLCSEVEWEKACKGKESEKYPYGNTYDGALCNTQGRNGEQRLPMKTGSFEKCISSYGAFDLSGNVLELTTSATSDSPVAAKGGSSRSSSYQAKCSSRLFPAPDARDPYTGFRCCRTPKLGD